MTSIDYYGGLRVTIQTSDIDDYPILVLHELANLYSTDEFLDMWEKNRNDLMRDLNHTCSQKVNVEQTQPDDSFISKILDKIKDSGYESLTKAEKDYLFDASKNI